MREYLTIELSSLEEFKEKLLMWGGAGNDYFCCLETQQTESYRSNPKTYSTFNCLIGLGQVNIIHLTDEKGALNRLSVFTENTSDWLFGGLTYDLKNDCEPLTSNNPDGVEFPSVLFFQPRYVFIISEEVLQVAFLPEYDTKKGVAELIHRIKNIQASGIPKQQPIDWHARFTKNQYFEAVNGLQRHLQIGDIYEANLCQEFYSEQVKLSPVASYLKLRQQNPSPFMAYLNTPTHAVLSASPERYIKKVGKHIISQPMKGTARKHKDIKEDERVKGELLMDKKELSENIMIVDLVRNDLARIAERGSVKVAELCGLYTFKTVHQLISTVAAELPNNCSLTDVLKTSFPMGSMTGAPKIRAMELIEEFEKTKRGLYAGSIGYITPKGDFDFNVIIRSLLYNKQTNYLSLQVGSAITSLSVPQKEYEECLLKAESLKNLFLA